MNVKKMFMKHKSVAQDAKAIMALIAIEPAVKAPFVWNSRQTSLMGQYNTKWPISLVYVLKPLINVIRAIARSVILLIRTCTSYLPFLRSLSHIKVGASATEQENDKTKKMRLTGKKSLSCLLSSLAYLQWWVRRWGEPALWCKRYGR